MTTRKNNTAFRNAKLLATSTLAAGVMSFAGTAYANSWADLSGTGFNTSTPDSVTTNIDLTDGIGRGYGDLDIYESHTVNVRMNNVGHTFVGTDISGDASQILGRLNSDGKIILINTNGVFFGQNSVIDVGSLIVSTGNIGEDDLLRNDGKYTFSDFGAGSIVNEGLISVADAGLAAFVSPTVINNGIINAKLGTVAFAAGSKVTLDLYGDQLVEIAVNDKAADALLENNGTIAAEGGQILMTAQAAKGAVDSVINMNGVATVASVSQVGGKIILSGGAQGKVSVKGVADASGTSGGSIEITGENIEGFENAFLFADATENGNGGNVYVYGQNTLFSGHVYARGGTLGGNGGFVEISAADQLGYNGGVNTTAANGAAGSFLLDPQFAIIHSGGLHNLLGLEYILSAQALANDLARNGTLTVQATNSIDVGTNAPLLGNDAIDLANYSYTQLKAFPAGCGTLCKIAWALTPSNYETKTGITTGNIELEANTVNFNKDLTIGSGNLTVDAVTINLDSKLSGYNTALDTVDLLDDARLLSTAATTTVNVESNKALIQQGVDLLDGNGTVNVAAGTYDESVYINEANVTLNGANAGLHGTDSKRGAETIIRGNDWYGIYTDAAGTVIDGVTVDMSLSPTASDYAVAGYNANNLALRNSVIGGANFGVFLYGGTVTRSTIDGNKFSNIHGANGQAIHVRDNQYADITNNNISDADVGITVENMYSKVASGTPVVSGNVVSASLIGIRNNMVSGNGTGYLVTGNTVTAESLPATARRWTGIDIISQPGTVASMFVDNDIDGSGAGAGRLTAGYEATNLVSGLTVIDGGSVKNVGVGVWATDGSSYTGTVNGLVIKNVAFDTIAEAAILAEDTEGNAGVNATGTAITIGAGNSFTNANYDLAIAGDNVTINLESGFDGVGKTLVKAAGAARYALSSLTTNNASIQTGINATAGGGQVDIEAGTFNEGNIEISKNMVISGAGKNATTINANGFDYGLLINDDLGNTNTTVRRLTVENAEKAGLQVNSTAGLKVLQLNQTAFNNNGYNGVAVYGNGLGELRILNSSFLNNGAANGSSGDGDILAYLYNGDVTLTNVTVESNNPANTSDYGIQIRGDNAIAASGEIVLDNVTVAGAYRAAQLGIQRYSDLDLSMNDVTLGGTTTGGTASTGWGALYISETGTNDLDLGNTAFLAHGGQYITLGMGAGYNTLNNIDATNVTFLGKTGATATKAENFAIEDKVFHKLDNAGQGLVTWHEGNLYVTQASGSIQRAIDASNAGGTVNVDHGIFTEQLTINKDLSLLGSGAFNTTVLNAPTIMTKSYTQDGREVYAIIHAKDAANIDIDGFQINGATNTGNTYTDSRRFVGVAYQNAGGDFTNNWVRNILTAGNTARSGFAFLATDKTGGASTLNLTGNDFTNFQTYGVALADKVVVTLKDNDITGDKDNVTAEQSGIYVTSGAKVTAGGAGATDGNRISETDIGVEVTGSANGHYEGNVLSGVHNGFSVLNSAKTTLLNNTIGGNSVTGVSFVNSNGSSITGGTIDSFVTGVLVDNSDNVTIDGVTLTNISDTHISVKDSDNATVKKNDMTGGKTGVALSNVTNSTVGGADTTEGNTIRNIASGWGNSGINVKGGSGLTISHNDLDNIGGHGIYAEHGWNAPLSVLSIDNNTIDNARFNGVYLKFWNGADIAANQIDGVTEGHGINLELNTATDVTGNFINNVSGNGINAWRGNNGLNIDDNNVTGATIGVLIDNFDNDNTGVTITNNNVSQTTQEGIKALRGTTRVSGNVVNTTGKGGIEVRDSAGVLVRDNYVGYIEIAPGVFDTLSDNNIKGDAILVANSAGAQVHGNHVMYATGYGIRVNNSNEAKIGTANFADRNFISTVDLDGIKISSGEGVTVENNSVYDAKRVGIYAEHATGLTVLGNNVAHTTYGIGSAYGGITADWGSNITISNNTVSGSGHGVMLYQNTGKNTVSGNVINGVSTNGVNANEVAGLTVSGNFIGFLNKTGTIGAPNNIGNAGININASANADVIGNDIATARHGIVANAANGLDVYDNDITGRGSSTGTGVTITASSNVNVGDYDQYKWLVIKTADRDNRINGFETGVSITGGTQSNVVNNTVGNVHYGVKLSGTTYADVLDNVLNGNSVTGIDITGGSHYATVQGNDITNFATGINVNASNDVVIGGWDVATLGTALFLGNNITNAVNGIVANNAQRIDIFGNRIVNGTAGGNGSGISITNSHDADIGGDGNWLVTRLKSNYITGFRDGIQSNASDRAEIVRNTVEDSRRDGIRVDRGDEVSVRNNKVEDVGSTGIWLNRLTDATASGNRIDGTGLSGIRAEGSGSNNVDILENRIDNTGTNGIAAVGVANLTIDGNKIGRDGGNIGTDGINVATSYAAQITDNQITHTGKNGIAVSGSAKTLIDGNRVGTQAGANNINGDGIVLRASNGTTITGNKVANTTSTGANVGNGISVFTSDEVVIGGPTSAERNTITNAAWDGIRIDGGYGHTVENNKIDVVERVGIWVKNVSGSMLNDNRIDDTGLSGIRAEGGYGVTIEGNHADNTGTHGISADTVGDLNVFGNFIGLKDDSTIDEDGIHVVNSDYVEIDGNKVENAYNGIAIREGRYAYVTNNVVTDNRDDGLDVQDQGGELIATGNTFNDNGDDGVDVENTTGLILIDDNTIDGNDDDGIDVVYPYGKTEYPDYEEEYPEYAARSFALVTEYDVNSLIISNNRSISGNGDNGIEVDGALSTEVISNLISNNGSRGLFMEGPQNGSVVLSDNDFLNNPIGAEFQSGEIDLTGEGNRFVGGAKALRFAPYASMDYMEVWNEGEGSEGEGEGGGYWSWEPVTSYAPMSLVSNTLGAQRFEGQSTYFVELDNGAFYNPGTPTILNALNSTYVTPFGTLTPASTAGVLTQQQYDFLERMFFHYADRSDLGLFFFGFVPNSPSVAQERIFNRFNAFRGQAGQFSITLTGMPNTGGAPAGGNTGGGAPSGGIANFLNSINPAAGGSGQQGGNNGGPSMAEIMAALEPAAGGNNTQGNTQGGAPSMQEASCWSDAIAAAANGVVTTINYDASPEAAFGQAANCGTGTF